MIKKILKITEGFKFKITSFFIIIFINFRGFTNPVIFF